MGGSFYSNKDLHRTKYAYHDHLHLDYKISAPKRCFSTPRVTQMSKSVSEDITLFSYSTQQSMNFFLLINVKMPTAVGNC